MRGEHDGSGYGVYGETDGGRGVFGRATATNVRNYGVFGQSDSTNGIGVYGVTTVATGANYGVYGLSSSATGSGVYGLGNSSNPNSSPVGVTGVTTNRYGYGVYGLATPTGTGFAGGVYGRVNGMGAGLYGETTGGPGSRAVYGYAGGFGGYAGLFESGPTRTQELGVGRDPVSNSLEVNGTASKSTAGEWLANSDARIKQDVETVTSALDTLNRVRLVSFRYTGDYLAKNDEIEDRRYLNVIAQEFAEVFPDHVQSSGEKLPDGSDILQVDTHPLTIYSAAAIQELSRKLDQKETEIAELKTRLANLEQFVNHKLNGGPQ